MTTTDEAIAALRLFKNVILEGPPGTGKSFSVAEIATEWPQGMLGADLKGNRADGRGAWAITFHPSTGYEEFVEGIRYNPSGNPKGFELMPGVFREWADAARRNPEKDFLVLIDEINRANVSKVLGDLLLCLESSKRLRHSAACTGADPDHADCWSGGATTRLPYSGIVLGVPDNLYVLGTMNSSDRSIAPLDAALRRRFAFVRVNPLAGDELKGRLESSLPAVGDEVIARSVAALDGLNSALENALGPDSTLGHSYLFDLGDAGSSSFWIEVNSGSVATGSQFQVIQEWATSLLGAVAPGESIKAPGTSVDLEVFFEESRFDVKLEHPQSKPNTQFSSSGIGFERRMKDGGVTIWTPLGLRKLRLEFVPANGDAPALVQQYLDRSAPGKSTSGRGYGRIDATERRGDRDERTVWRYSILPQLIDTVTQAFVPEILIAGLREAWVRDNLPAGVQAKVRGGFADFEQFLNRNLGLRITQAGFGLTSGLTIEEYATAAPTTGRAKDGEDDDQSAGE
ncbi:McrB family protein [Leifsonia sp. NCR5]|uniref:McrB family protein n=1 Tax=Leifsonia sp. NCR5 TaxID=1978342 RepID=UPI000A18D640|nr:AAA family ATPase [Leifsonia sp. NCR5]